MKKILITGAAGTIGTACCEYFIRNGYYVIGIDNDYRGRILGPEASIKKNKEYLINKYSDLEFYDFDISEDNKIEEILGNHKVKALIHCASQPSHPKSIEIPYADFINNVVNTVKLLEILKNKSKDTVFVFCSSNKVYGENPNSFELVESETRYNFKDIIGIDETCSLDHTLHTPLGASKLAADIYTQEYLRLYDLPAGVFRLSCVTGIYAKAIESHNWIPYIINKIKNQEVIKIFGYKGKQVRDIIDASDVAKVFDLFINNPAKDNVFNLGGGAENSISILELIKIIENQFGCRVQKDFLDKRMGDHCVYISDNTKIENLYNFKPTLSYKSIIKNFI